MIDGEQVLESAQETGYRLCSMRTEATKDVEKNSIFSASWDPNNKNRLYVCSQNGMLHSYDLELGTERRFQVLFRRYTSSAEDLMDEGKAITYHWDKMTAIPGRPEELVFLMGVSKNLMYTALPR